MRVAKSWAAAVKVAFAFNGDSPFEARSWFTWYTISSTGVTSGAVLVAKTEPVEGGAEPVEDSEAISGPDSATGQADEIDSAV